jgi:hypothetical protein
MLPDTGWTQSIQMRLCKKDGTTIVYNIEDIRKLTFANIAGINDQQFTTLVKNFNLLKSYPNPFSATTTVSYTLPFEGVVDITIVDLKGNLIQRLPGGNQAPGEHTVTWDGKAATGLKAHTGLYFCKVRFNDQIQSNKIVFIN